MLKQFIDFLSDIIFTVKCPYCGKAINRKSIACDDCFSRFPKKDYTKVVADNCKCVCPFEYSSIFKKAVLSFKFGGNGRYAKNFAIPMKNTINNVYSNKKFDIITCVPMHKKDKSLRGYNQAELLAKQCADALDIPFMNLLRKTKRNSVQHKLNAYDRVSNVIGVYEAINTDLIKEKNILIIDDIITTGSTLKECVYELRLFEPKDIQCAALCSVTKSGNA